MVSEHYVPRDPRYTSLLRKLLLIYCLFSTKVDLYELFNMAINSFFFETSGIYNSFH